MSLTVEIGTGYASADADPPHGRRVVFEVRLRTITIRNGWTKRTEEYYVVGLKGSDGDGFSHHRSFERAARSMIWRARRYEKAYSVPRSVVAHTPERVAS